MRRVSYDELFRAFSNEIRRDILRTLEEHDKCVMEIVKELREDQTTISHNLQYLNRCGFIFVEKQGKKRIYKINERTVKPLMKIMEQHIQRMKDLENEI